MMTTPLPYRIIDRAVETADTVTLTLRPQRDAMPAWAPGQFAMAYAFGIGEVPLSISGGTGDEVRHTVRDVGAVTRAITAAGVGAVLGLRGPYGTGWPAPPPAAEVTVVAGGIGLAPLRPVILDALSRPDCRLRVLIGARTPHDLIFTDEYEKWRSAGATVRVTVDRAETGWTGHVGVVTTLLDPVGAPSDVRAGMRRVGYVCGPELMMRLSARALVERGLAAADIAVSLERNMRCGVGTCGHCQLGPLLLCRAGPVVSAEVAEPLFATREL